MKARSLTLWAAVALLSCVGAWAQCSSLATDPQAIAAIKKRAISGDAEAQCGLGMMFDMGIGLPQDFAKAALWLRKAAEQGVPDAAGPLGVLYRNGNGVQKDYTEALFWLQKAAEKGVDGAQFNLGLMYYNGQGVPKDLAKAAFWYRKAAEQGQIDAQYNLALQLMNGWGVPQNTEEAMMRFRRAAEKGNVQAQYLLGSIYDEGGLRKAMPGPDGSYNNARLGGYVLETPKDFGLAAKWYRMAAEQGNAFAQNRLGSLYADGKGVPQDYAEAYFWLSLGNASGSHSTTNDVDDRDLAASHLTKTVLLETQERAQKWFAAHQPNAQ